MKNAEKSDMKLINQVIIDIEQVETGGKSLLQALKDGEISVGDYVNYKPDINEKIELTKEDTGYDMTQVYETDENTRWRILGISEDKNHVLLISGSPVKKQGEDPYLVLQGAQGYLKGSTVLNKIARLYYNSKLTHDVRSINIDDINRILGGITIKYYGDSLARAAVGGYVYLNADKNKNVIGMPSVDKRYTYTGEDYSPESAIQNKKATEGIAIDANGYNYWYNYEGYKYYDVDITKSVYDMLFADTTADANYSKAYWLDSPQIFSANGIAAFSIGSVKNENIGFDMESSLFMTMGYWNATGLAVRPVISLNKEVTIKQINNIVEQKTEEKWDTAGGKNYGQGNI